MSKPFKNDRHGIILREINNKSITYNILYNIPLKRPELFCLMQVTKYKQLRNRYERPTFTANVLS